MTNPFEAADQDDDAAQFRLGLMYYLGDGVPRNDAKAIRFFRLAANQGYAQAQLNLGIMYADGKGFAQDDAKAVIWYRLAAEQGHARAQNNLGFMFDNGRGVPQDDEEAVKWYLLAAEQGHTGAQNNIGLMYANGEGVPQNDAESLKWYRLAADQGHAGAQNNLGLMYANGRGTAQDDAEAVKWFCLAAEQGHAKAQLNLGVMSMRAEAVLSPLNQPSIPSSNLENTSDEEKVVSNQPAQKNCAELLEAPTLKSPSIRHLHLPPNVSEKLEEIGCSTIADISILLRKFNLKKEIRRPLMQSMAAMMSCLSGTSVDWLKFYERPDFQCQGLFFHCNELSFSDIGDLNFAVDQNSFGNAGAMLERAGLGDFASLIKSLGDGIEVAPLGMGPTKVRELWDHLIALAKSSRADPSFMKRFSLRFPLYDGPIFTSQAPNEIEERQEQETMAKLSECSLRLDIGVLHIGAKTSKLRENGIDCVQDLLNTPRDEMLSWQGMGKSTMSRIQESIEALKRAQLPDGNVDWATFCSHMQLSLLPLQDVSGSMAEKILLLSSVIEESILAGETDENRLILHERIMCPPSKRLSLEAVSELMPVKITRERVRQKEEKILKRLAGALIYNDYAQAPYHFRPEFTAPWMRAAQYFANVPGNVSLSTLIEGLEDAWGVSKDIFSEQLPLILAIITGELASGADFKRALPEGFPLLAQGSGMALELPLRKLQIGKAARNLEEQGIQTVSEFLTAISVGNIEIADNKSTKTTYDQINLLAQSVYDNGDINWPQYAQDADVPDFPLYLVQTPEHFLDSIIPTAVGVLESRQLSSRAAAIFEMRTAVGIESRPTVEAMTKLVGGYQSEIKRVETKLLNFLREVFIDGYVCLARANVDQEFLSYWAVLDQTFEKFDGDTELLQREICDNWGVSNDELAKYMPPIIAVLSGYPMGRLGQHGEISRKPQQPRKELVKVSYYANKPELAAKMVSLRGFGR